MGAGVQRGIKSMSEKSSRRRVFNQGSEYGRFHVKCSAQGHGKGIYCLRGRWGQECRGGARIANMSEKSMRESNPFIQPSAETHEHDQPCDPRTCSPLHIILASSCSPLHIALCRNTRTRPVYPRTAMAQSHGATLLVLTVHLQRVEESV